MRRVRAKLPRMNDAADATVGDRFRDRGRRRDGSTPGVGNALVRRMAAEGLAGAVVTGRNADRGERACVASAEAGCDTLFVADDLGGRLISTGELVRTLAFVLSDDAAMKTGTIVDFDQSVQGAGELPLPPPEIRR